MTVAFETGGAEISHSPTGMHRGFSNLGSSVVMRGLNLCANCSPTHEQQVSQVWVKLASLPLFEEIPM